VEQWQAYHLTKEEEKAHHLAKREEEEAPGCPPGARELCVERLDRPTQHQEL
jgi:hypothetical protein